MNSKGKFRHGDKPAECHYYTPCPDCDSFLYYDEEEGELYCEKCGYREKVGKVPTFEEDWDVESSVPALHVNIDRPREEGITSRIDLGFDNFEKVVDKVKEQLDKFADEEQETIIIEIEERK